MQRPDHRGDAYLSVLVDDTFADRNAHGWINYFAARGCSVEEPYRGCLIGWDTPRIGHIAVVANAAVCIEAGGGGSSTDYARIPSDWWARTYPAPGRPYANPVEHWHAQCIAKGAQVCARAIDRDRTVAGIVDPFILLDQ